VMEAAEPSGKSHFIEQSLSNRQIGRLLYLRVLSVSVVDYDVEMCGTFKL
jgi:hypothetical protein